MGGTLVAPCGLFHGDTNVVSHQLPLAVCVVVMCVVGWGRSVFFWDVLEEKAIQPYGFLIYLKILKVGWLVACWLVDSVFLWSEVNVYKIGNYVFYVRKSVRYIVYI